MKLLTVVVTIVAGLSLQYSITRRLDMTYDGKPAVVEEGQELELPCKHAEGKTHRLKVARAKTYEFKGLGVRLDFESSMNVIVEQLGSVTNARFMHSGGSHANIQQFHAVAGEGALERMEAGIKAQFGPTGKFEPSKPSELEIGGETLKGFSFTGKLGAVPVHLACYWREAEGGGHMISFCTIGSRPAGVGDAFALIAKSIEFEP